MEAAKVIIEVVAGLVPGTPVEAYSKTFGITSGQWQQPDEVMKVYGYAQEYMRTLWSPQHINWVKCEWIYL